MGLHNCTKKKKDSDTHNKKKKNYPLLFFCSYLIILSNKKRDATDAGDHEYNHISHGGLNNSELHLGF